MFKYQNKNDYGIYSLDNDNTINQKDKYSIGSFDSSESPVKNVIRLNAPILSVSNGTVFLRLLW